MFGIYGTSDRALVLASALALKDQEVFIYTPEEEALEEIMDGHLKQFKTPVDEMFKKADQTKKISYSGNLQTLLNCEMVFLSGRLVKGETDPKAAMRFIEQDVLSLLRKAAGNRKKADNFNLVLIDQLPYGGYKVLTETIESTDFEIGEDYLDDGLKESDIAPVAEVYGRKVLQFNMALSPLMEPKGDLTSFIKRPLEAVIGSYSDSLIGRLKEVYKLLKISKKNIYVSTPEAVETGLILKDAYRLIQQIFMNEVAQVSDSDLFYELVKNTKLPTASFQLDNTLIENVSGLTALNQGLEVLSKSSTIGLESVEKMNQKAVSSLVDYFSESEPDSVTVAITGIAQKPGSSNMRGAQVIDLIKSLTEEGFKINIYMKEGPEDLKWRLRSSNESITYSKDLYSSVKGADAFIVLGKVGRPVDLKRIAKNMSSDPVLYDPLGLFRERKDLDSFILI